MEAQNFYRLIKLKGYLKVTEKQPPNDENEVFKSKHKQTPDKKHNSVEKDINNAKNEPRKRPKQNLTKGEMKALRQLEKRNYRMIQHCNITNQ